MHSQRIHTHTHTNRANKQIQQCYKVQGQHTKISDFYALLMNDPKRN